MKKSIEVEKNEMEERIRSLERELNELKSYPITSLDSTSVTFPQKDHIKREGNAIIHHGDDLLSRTCFIGRVMTSV